MPSQPRMRCRDGNAVGDRGMCVEDLFDLTRRAGRRHGGSYPQASVTLVERYLNQI